MHQLMALQLTITGTVAAVSFSASGRSDLLLVLPWTSYLLCGRYISQEYGIDRIGEYNRRHLAHIIPGSLGWEKWMVDHPRRLTTLGWRIPLIVAFPGVAIFALALSAKPVFGVRQHSVVSVALIIVWFVGLILTILSVVTINWILDYRKKAHIVTFALDGTRSLSALVFDVDGLMIDSERRGDPHLDPGLDIACGLAIRRYYRDGVRATWIIGGSRRTSAHEDLAVESPAD